MSHGNRFCGCSVWALAPFLLFLVSCCLLRCFLWRNASLAGGFAGRRVWFVLVVVCFSYRFACSNGHDLSLYKCPSSLSSCKDRAFSATSATLEEKILDSKTKKGSVPGPLEALGSFLFFFRPTPSWLSPGRYTRSTAADKLNCNLLARLSIGSAASKELVVDQYTVQ